MSAATPEPTPRSLDGLIDDVFARLVDAGSAAWSADALAACFGARVDPGITLDSDPPAGATAELVDRLAGRRAPDRYAVLRELGRGGMGIVYEAWDRDLRRRVALKLLRQTPTRRGSAGRVSRFLEEAQIAAQLEHPCILPVYEVGLDAAGGVYFAMQLVRGQSLGDLVEARKRGSEAWTLAGQVGVLTRVAEAMAYAHTKGVLHRDLKPSNVMVGRFGETYVCDWGLAKLLDTRSSPEDSAPVSTALREARDGSTPLATRTGAVFGTPAYMAPEQAAGNIDLLDERTDIYALGAMLYHVLAGEPPYADTPRSTPEPWNAVLAGPPRPLGPDVPPELVSIVHKAMARDPFERYATMQALGGDLRAWLEGRVVAAHGGGAWAELGKWVRRNRGLSAALCGGLLALVAGGTASTWLFARAEARAADVLRLSALQDLNDLERRAETLWPISVARIPDYVEWLRSARELVLQQPGFEAQLAELAGRSLLVDPAEIERRRRAHPLAQDIELLRTDIERRTPFAEAIEAGAPNAQQALVVDGLLPTQDQVLEEARTRLAALEKAVEPEVPRRFASSQDAWWYDQLDELVRRLRELSDPETGLVSGSDPLLGPGIELRLARARELEAVEAHDALLWNEACAAIRANPRYQGLRIDPQPDLAPLGPDPSSGLWEFAHRLTGTVPRRGPDRRLHLTDDTAVVFVLVPGATFVMGAQALDPLQFRFDLYATGIEGPLHDVTLQPFLISKYEMTQAQWQRCTGANPSVFQPARLPARVTPRNPVESITWEQATRTLGWIGLALPTEAQWEYAARAETRGPWWTGSERERLQGLVNLADASAATVGPGADTREWPDYEDPFTYHGPVDSEPANPFGLQGVLGNVAEWCQDRGAEYGYPTRSGDGLALVPPVNDTRSVRGGHYLASPSQARVTARGAKSATERTLFLGVRPARNLGAGSVP